MDSRILKNSYIVAVIVFIILCIIFYVFGIGTTTVIVEGKPVRKFSWKYPLAIALVVWLIWYFYLFPPPKKIVPPTYLASGGSSKHSYHKSPRINMDNWN